MGDQVHFPAWAAFQGKQNVDISMSRPQKKKNTSVLINPSKAYKPWVVLSNTCRDVRRFKLPKEVWETTAWDQEI